MYQFKRNTQNEGFSHNDAEYILELLIHILNRHFLRNIFFYS